MTDTVETIANEASYIALQMTSPKLISAIRRLLSLGLTPQQIEQHVIKHFENSDIAPHIRSAAEHMQKSEEDSTQEITP